MSFTLRYQNGDAAVHSDVEGALAQAVHDFGQPHHLNPAALLRGDVSAEHAGLDIREFDVLLGTKDLRSIPKCPCPLCERHRRAPKIQKLQDELLKLHVVEPELVIAGERELAEWLKKNPRIKGGGVPGGGFGITSSAVGLTAATAKTTLGVLSGANTPVDIVELEVGADATTGNLLVEIVYGTNATNAPGTNSTAFTPLQLRGPTQTMNGTAGITWTAEPTVLTVVKRFPYMPMPGGPLVVQWPLGRETNSIVAAATSGKFLGIRLTASATVTNSSTTVEVEE